MESSELDNNSREASQAHNATTRISNVREALLMERIETKRNAYGQVDAQNEQI
jgi:hypothetical protein